MNQRMWLRISTGIKLLCLCLVVSLLTTVPTFAEEPETGNPQDVFSAETGVINPRVAFSQNGNKLFLFDENGCLLPKAVSDSVGVFTLDGRTYVPIREFCRALGYNVTYNEKNNAVCVNYGDQSCQLREITTLKDLSKEDQYFLIDGDSYTQVENFILPENLSVTRRDKTLLLYSTALLSQGGSAASFTTVGGVSDVATDSGISGTVEIFTVRDEKPVLTDAFVQMVQGAGELQKDYRAILRKRYDPTYYKPFVNPYVPYSYPQMQKDIKELTEFFPGYIKSYSAGKSVEGRDLTTIELGNGSKHIYVIGSHHAREYISTAYIMKFVNEVAYAAQTGENVTKYDVRTMLAKVTFHIIPMMNPDGVNLVQNGINSVSPALREKVRAMPLKDGAKYGYKSWKSNINGVDLNRNYPTNWVAFKSKNASSLYPGPYAASEPEVRAVMEYMKQYKPAAIIAIHSQGELLYWSNPEKNLGSMGKKMLQSSGYRPILNLKEDATAGYLSNYAREVHRTYEITIELCKYIGPFPYPDARFDEVWAKSKDLLYIVGDELAKQGESRVDAYVRNHKGIGREEAAWKVAVNMDKPEFTNAKVLTKAELNNICVLVNKRNRVPDGYTPVDLVKVAGNISLRSEAKKAFDQMAAQAKNEGFQITPVSGFRTVNYQEGLYKRYLKSDSLKNVETYSARAGFSEHHTGLAVDVAGSNQSMVNFQSCKEAGWVSENAWKYGFIVRYLPEQSQVTGYKSEPWHLRYVGLAVSKQMKEKGIKTLEEYVGREEIMK